MHATIGIRIYQFRTTPTPLYCVIIVLVHEMWNQENKIWIIWWPRRRWKTMEKDKRI